VPIELRTQQAVRPAQELAFCYLCGLPFQDGDQKNRDHVPPSAIFLEADRNFPLILPTHYLCNHDRHLEDQTIGQLVGILHNQAPDPEHLRMRLMAGIAADGQLFVAAGGFDLRAIIRRWVFGFHAALYGEFLNAGQQFMTFPPLAEGDKDTGQIQPVQAIVPEIVRVLRFNRGLGGVDRVVTRNGKCVYECVWIESDAPGVWFCAYALDLYGWVHLGDVDRFGRRGCVGMYVRADGTAQSQGTKGDRHPDDYKPDQELDPFPPNGTSPTR
jgi:hypothetical protein